MRLLLRLAPAVLAAAGLAGLYAADAPDKLVFQSKYGNVNFDHKKHSEVHAKKECKTCHPAVWPQDAKAPLNFKAGMHKPAEAKKTSCGTCHHAGGASFASTGNCNKCHVKAAAKKD